MKIYRYAKEGSERAMKKPGWTRMALDMPLALRQMIREAAAKAGFSSDSGWIRAVCEAAAKAGLKGD